MKSPTRYVKNPALLESEIGEERVLMNMSQGAYFGMNDVGNFIFKLCEKPVSLDDIVTSLLVAFEIEEETCRQQTVDFVEAMTRHELVVEVKDSE